MNEIVRKYLANNGFIPRDKGWTIRMTFLDLIRKNDPKYAISYLTQLPDLSDDEKDAITIAQQWNESGPFGPIESRTLYILLQFYLWKYRINRTIIPKATLIKRIEESLDFTPHVTNWALENLFTLMGRTSQVATAAILCGNTEHLSEVVFYVDKTYYSICYWDYHEAVNKPWEGQLDPTITVQLEEYLNYLKYGKINEKPSPISDCDLCCFLIAFGVMTSKQAAEFWPQICKHESNRAEAVDIAFMQWRSGKLIETKDHRVIHALAMLMQSENLSISTEDVRRHFKYPDHVTKAWANFWSILPRLPKALYDLRDFI